MGVFLLIFSTYYFNLRRILSDIHINTNNTRHAKHCNVIDLSQAPVFKVSVAHKG